MKQDSKFYLTCFVFISFLKRVIFEIVRYAYPWWKEKVIDSDLKRKEGLCPMTPEETALILRALNIDQNIQIYIAAGEIYGGDRRMASLTSEFPNLVSKTDYLRSHNIYINI